MIDDSAGSSPDRADEDRKRLAELDQELSDLRDALRHTQGLLESSTRAHLRTEHLLRDANIGRRNDLANIVKWLRKYPNRIASTHADDIEQGLFRPRDPEKSA